MAIAVAEAAPQTACVAYLGGDEENEIASARLVARKLGLRHESLVCDPGRSYDRYLAIVSRMPLLTADFALLSYVDLATEILANGGDGILDALGSRSVLRRARPLAESRTGAAGPGAATTVWRARMAPCRQQFQTLLCAWNVADGRLRAILPRVAFHRCRGQWIARKRDSHAVQASAEGIRADIAQADSMEARRRVSATVLESAIFAKGMYAAKALALHLAYPYCEKHLCDWVFHEVPDDWLIGPGGVNKVLVRRHIAQHFKELPYVATKGSFRFDLCGLASQRFDQVHAFAVQARALLPGAPHWLERHRSLLRNKYVASKFYLLAIALPWLCSRMEATSDRAHVSIERSVLPWPEKK